jgi:hypothetical protein
MMIRNEENDLNRMMLIELAVEEQLKSQGAEDNLEKGKRGTVAIPQQMVGSRRRTEDIFAGMIKDEWARKELINRQLPTQRITKKKNSRKRKRGPRTVRYS